jgi:hypothetical protein
MFGAYQGGVTQTVCDMSQRRGGLEARLEITAVDDLGQYSKRQEFFVRLNNGTKAISDERERQRYVSQRWGSGPI